MTPQEERLVLELHAKWGNRWSRIARKLPGRTDNEIKNYWRTHMRKKAQEKKQARSPSSSSSNCSSTGSNPAEDSLPIPEAGEESFYDTGGPDSVASAEKPMEEEVAGEKGYTMDDIWKDIALSEENHMELFQDSYSEEGSFSYPLPLPSPPWEYCLDPLWKMDEILPMGDPFFPCYGHGGAALTG